MLHTRDMPLADIECDNLPRNDVGISLDGLIRGISCILVAAGDSVAPKGDAIFRRARSKCLLAMKAGSVLVLGVLEQRRRCRREKRREEDSAITVRRPQGLRRLLISARRAALRLFVSVLAAGSRELWACVVI